MKKKIPFDIKYRPQIESGEVQVVTRDNSPVRIVCWDVKHDRNILGLISVNEAEVSCEWYNDGLFDNSQDPIGDYDLFLLVEELEELTEFERTFIRLQTPGINPDDMSEDAIRLRKEQAAEET